MGYHTHSGRLERWLCGIGRGPRGVCHSRQRHGRLDPPTGRTLRRGRPQAQLRPSVPLRPRCLCIIPRPDRPDCPNDAGLRLAIKCHHRQGFARLDITRPAGGGFHREARRRLERREAGRSEGIFRGRHEPKCPLASRGGHPTLQGTRRGDHRSFAATHLVCGGSLLHHCHRRGLGEPRPLRRRALRPPRQESPRPARPLHALARGGLRQRGQTPHHSRHLCSLERLLRCLLPARPEGSHAHPAGFHKRV